MPRRALPTLFILIASTAGTAQAAMTFVDPLGNNGNERCLIGPVCGGPGTAYNGEISIIHALEMDTSSTLLRVDDSLDRIWQATITTGGQVITRARYASHTLELGFDAGAGYQALVTNTSNGQVLVSNPGMFTGAHASDFVAIPSGWTRIPVSPTSLFAFVLNDVSSGNKWTSNDGGSGVGAAGYANSSNGQDHMLTFRDSADPNHYVLAWEDLPLSSSDKDYNDMVVEVRFVNPVPLPAAGLLLLSGLLGLGGLRRTSSARTAIRCARSISNLGPLLLARILDLNGARLPARRPVSGLRGVTRRARATIRVARCTAPSSSRARERTRRRARLWHPSTPA